MDLTRKVYCNRTLNLRSIRAIGYDMDYTLVHYHANEWEERAYENLRGQLAAQGWPVADVRFQPDLIARGLIIDMEKGNLVKANRFGFVKRAMHGTRLLDFEEQREAYSRTIVDLADKRWVFLNTLFSLSEGCMYAQMVDLLDSRRIPEVLDYASLYHRVKHLLDIAHMEGKLKAEILAHPEKYVYRDAETALALLDQYHAGKKLMLITNSEWQYTAAMMSYVFDGFLPQTPKKMTWRDLFEIVIVSARKPSFFTTESPFLEVVTTKDGDGLLRPITSGVQRGGAYFGGSAAALERALKLSGDEILYVGDHMFGDVHVTKNVLRWRTALILSELEDEIRGATDFASAEQTLTALMEQKEGLELQLSLLKVEMQRTRAGYGPASTAAPGDLQKRYDAIREKLIRIDQDIVPLVKASGELNNPLWGLLMRAGNDKSYLAYQMERYADIYTSRVSNFLLETPFTYFRSPRGSLPHDPGHG